MAHSLCRRAPLQFGLGLVFVVLSVVVVFGVVVRSLWLYPL
jgi:hypothetical protein